MIAVAVVALSITVAERLRQFYREQEVVRSRLLIKQKIVRALGPAAAPQDY
jgi:hypothetical protein